MQSLSSSVLYHLPRVEGIDGVILSAGNPVLVQVTTAKSGLKAKYQKLVTILNQQKSPVTGWFISLYPYENGELLVTSGEQLIELLGGAVYHRLLEIKER